MCTLAQWGLLKDAHDMDGLRTMGLGVRKITVDASRPCCVPSEGDQIEASYPDLEWAIAYRE